MELTQWYAVALGLAIGGLIPLLALTGKLLTRLRINRTFVGYCFQKYLLYRDLHHHLAGQDRTTWFECIFVFVFLAGNVFCATFQVKDVSGLKQRVGILSMCNLVPMPLGARMNCVADLCGVEIRGYAKIHRWIGRAAITHGLIHVATALHLQSPDIDILRDIPGLTAAIAVVVTLLSTLPLFRRHAYEAFVVFHKLLFVSIMVALYLHIPRRGAFESPTVYLLAILCLEGFCRLLQLAQVIYRNIRLGQTLSRAKVKTLTFKRPIGRDLTVSDAVHIHVRVSRDWQPKPGQYVYLRLLNMTYTTWIQSHPFYVSWWYKDANGHRYVVLIVERRRGFTKHLFLCANDNPRKETELRALVEGPYGMTPRLHSYGTVLLFATGIGVSGQLPHLKQLMDDYHNGIAKSRKVALFWEMKSELHAAWVADMMHELLRKDSDLILSIALFVQDDFISSESRQGDSRRLGERIRLTYAPMNVQTILKSELQIRKGRTIVSIGTDARTARIIRKTVQSQMEKDTDMVELEFTPPKARERGSWWEAIRTMIGPKKDTEAAGSA